MTGASGYIGRRVMAALASRNCDALPMTRTSGRESYGLRFDLSDVTTHHCPGGVDAMIHLAANTRNIENRVALDEVEACRRLAQSASDQGVRFIFVSSQTARHDAPTSYGLTKWECEKVSRALGGINIRLGLVYGSVAAGLFGQMLGFVRRLPVYPVLLPAPRVQPVHVDDVAQWLVQQALCAQPETLSQLGAWPPIRFDQFLAAIARHRLRVWRLGIPVPLRLITTLVKISQPLGLKLAAAERLVSLAQLPTMDTSCWARDHAPRQLEDGMHPAGSGRQRKLLLQARPVYQAVCGPTVSNQMLRPFARIVGSANAQLPNSLSNPAQAALAMSLAESSQLAAHKTLMVGQAAGWRGLVWAVCKAMWFESIHRLSRLFIRHRA